MMKLYYLPGACSLASNIALREAGVPFELDQVDRATRHTKSGKDFKALNPKNYVPALELDDGQILTEGAAVLQYIADRAPEKKLAPAAASFERIRLQEWLTFISSEVHKNFSPLFNPKAPDEWKAICKQTLAARFELLVAMIGDKTYVMGDTFTVADAYLFTVLRWARHLKVELPAPLQAYLERVGARPKVHEALVAEGLAK